MRTNHGERQRHCLRPRVSPTNFFLTRAEQSIQSSLENARYGVGRNVRTLPARGTQRRRQSAHAANLHPSTSQSHKPSAIEPTRMRRNTHQRIDLGPSNASCFENTCPTTRFNHAARVGASDLATPDRQEDPVWRDACQQGGRPHSHKEDHPHSPASDIAKCKQSHIHFDTGICNRKQIEVIRLTALAKGTKSQQYLKSIASKSGHHLLTGI